MSTTIEQATETVTINKQALAGWIIAQRRLFARIDLAQIFGDDPDPEVVQRWDDASEWMTAFEALVDVSLADCEHRGPTIWDMTVQPTDTAERDALLALPDVSREELARTLCEIHHRLVWSDDYDPEWCAAGVVAEDAPLQRAVDALLATWRVVRRD